MTAMLSRNMGRLVHINTPGYIEFIRRFIQDGCKVAGNDEKTGKYALMLYYALFQCPISNTKFATIDDALNAIGAYPLFVSEMSEICDYLMEHLENTTMPLTPDYAGLELHGCYDKNEIFILLGRQTATQTMQGMAAGVLRLDETQTEVFFVTLNKSEKEFSPSTQYKDYFISENHFHWQSQNTDSHAKSGKRFVEQKSNGKKFILFVRESKRDGYGNTCPFHCLGYVDYIRSSGDFPMNIEWHLRNPAMPCYVQAV